MRTPELGSAPNQEFLTLTLNPRINFLCGFCIPCARVKNSGPKFSTFFRVWVRFRVIIGCVVALVCAQYILTLACVHLFIKCSRSSTILAKKARRSRGHLLDSISVVLAGGLGQRVRELRANLRASTTTYN